MGSFIIGLLVFASIITIPFCWLWRWLGEIGKALRDMDRHHYDR